MKCANCSNEARYFIDDPRANPVAYCRLHLPDHLLSEAANGAFPLPAPAAATETKKSTSSK